MLDWTQSQRVGSGRRAPVFRRTIGEAMGIVPCLRAGDMVARCDHARARHSEDGCHQAARKSRDHIVVSTASMVLTFRAKPLSR